MKLLTKLLHAFAILGAVGSAALYYLNNTDATSLRERAERSENLLSKTLEQSKQLSSKNSELLEEIEGKDDALDEARANITVLATRNTQLKRETQRFTEELDNRVLEEEKLQREIARLSREKAEIQASTVALDEVKDYTRQITELQEQVLQLKDTSARFPGSVAQTIDTETSTPLPNDLNAKILTVGPKSSFVILNVGYESGIRMSHSLSIARGSETIAQIEITEVKEKLSIARILPESLKLQIKEGDTVLPL